MERPIDRIEKDIKEVSATVKLILDLIKKYNKQLEDLKKENSKPIDEYINITYDKC